MLARSVRRRGTRRVEPIALILWAVGKSGTWSLRHSDGREGAWRLRHPGGGDGRVTRADREGGGVGVGGVGGGAGGRGGGPDGVPLVEVELGQPVGVR